MRFPPAPDAPLPDAQREHLRGGIPTRLRGQYRCRVGGARCIAAIRIANRNGPPEHGRRCPVAAGNGEAPSDTGGDPAFGAAISLRLSNRWRPLRCGLNIDSQKLLLLLDVQAVPESYLAGVLTDQQADERLDGYRPDYPMQFRSRGLQRGRSHADVGSDLWPILIRKWGLNFDELAQIAKGLTGEMVGGMDMDQGPNALRDDLCPYTMQWMGTII